MHPRERIPRVHVVWWRVITDLEKRGVSLRAIAVECGVSLATIYYWKGGAEPRHYLGETLRKLYEREMGEEVPTSLTRGDAIKPPPLVTSVATS